MPSYKAIIHLSIIFSGHPKAFKLCCNLLEQVGHHSLMGNEKHAIFQYFNHDGDDFPTTFEACLHALIRRADSYNLELIRIVYPIIVLELIERREAPGGILWQEDIAPFNRINKDVLIGEYLIVENLPEMSVWQQEARERV